jgi:cytidylate kinase
MGNTIDNPLLVFDYDGTARGGRGAIIANIAKDDPTIATDQTGADYRALTRILIDDGRIELDMPTGVVAAKLGRLAVPEITSIVERRNEIVARQGLLSFYTPDVSELVSAVSPIRAIREAVKVGFTRRVEAIIQDDEHGTLLVDGRNLAHVVASLPAAKLVMSTFVSCPPMEAAMRELVGTGQEDSNEALVKAYKAIRRRNNHDAERTIDPVIPDADAIDYWYDQDIFTHSLQRIADRLRIGDLMCAAGKTSSGFRD